MSGSSEWVRAASVDDLAVGGRKLFRHFDKRIAVFRTERGIYAVDNRCPHQGYALLQGEMREETLTCSWHNWKFELDQNGKCSFGGEAVRSYPVKVKEGQILVDVLDPGAEAIAPQLFESLIDALGDVDIGRLARDTMRLQRIGTPLTEVVRAGVNFGAPRMEYGWNHSLATLTDCLNLAAMFEGELQSLPVIQGMSVVSQNETRRPPRARPEPADIVAEYGSIASALSEFPRLVDAEKAVDAESLIRGAIVAGASPEQIRSALLSAITDHFLGYGHPMIYAQKAFDILDRIGWKEADAVIGALVPSIVLSTRYDNLPYMTKFNKAWDAENVDLAELVSIQNGGEFDAVGFRQAVLGSDPSFAFGSVLGALKSGVSVTRLLDETSRAATERLRRFNIDIDTDDSNEWGWLDVTHNLTYLNALRWAWKSSPSPEVLRGVFHAVWFVNFTQRFDRKGENGVVEPSPTRDAGEILTAVRDKNPEKAEAVIAGFEGPERELHSALAQAASEDNSVAPIMVAHTVKTTRAAIVESTILGDKAPMVSAGRFLASPKRERFVYNATLEAIDFMKGRAKEA